jgi:hypothetical protein
MKGGGITLLRNVGKHLQDLQETHPRRDSNQLSMLFASLLLCQSVIRFKYGHITISTRIQGKIVIGMVPDQSFANVANFKYFERK